MLFNSVEEMKFQLLGFDHDIAKILNAHGLTIENLIQMSPGQIMELKLELYSYQQALLTTYVLKLKEIGIMPPELYGTSMSPYVLLSRGYQWTRFLWRPKNLNYQQRQSVIDWLKRIKSIQWNS